MHPYKLNVRLDLLNINIFYFSIHISIKCGTNINPVFYFFKTSSDVLLVFHSIKEIEENVFIKQIFSFVRSHRIIDTILDC